MKIAKIAKKKYPKSKVKQIRYVHDWLCRNVKPYPARNAKGIKMKENQAYYAYGALVKKRAWCAGYAEAFSLVMSYLGVKTRYCESEEHSWNEVKVDGKWKVVDCISDDPMDYADNDTGSYLSRDYFLKTYNQVLAQDAEDEREPGLHDVSARFTVKAHKRV